MQRREENIKRKITSRSKGRIKMALAGVKRQAGQCCMQRMSKDSSIVCAKQNYLSRQRKDVELTHKIDKRARCQ